MPDGAIATINAGWQERESDSVELADVLGGRMTNLQLYRRWIAAELVPHLEEQFPWRVSRRGVA